MLDMAQVLELQSDGRHLMYHMLEEPHLLIMDEPLSGLDARAQQELEELFGQLKGTGVGIRRLPLR